MVQTANKEAKQEKFDFKIITFWVIMLGAFIVRFWGLGDIPLGINQDEALSGYDAFCLLMTGADHWGISNPIYLMGWGSGTSVLYALLAKISFYIFDADVWALRLPQAIMGAISCYVFYLTLKLFYDKATAIVGLFLFSIMPWAVMNSRWGLDANVAPWFWLLGFYFYCRAVKDIRYLFISAVFYALTMYAYAGFWLFMAVTTPLEWGYLLWLKRNKETFINCVLSGGLWVLLIMPLIWFFLVNLGGVPEYMSNFFSVPKLLFWRGGEVGLDDFKTKFNMFSNLLFYQNDGWLANMIPRYGLFYMFSPALMLVGLVCMSARAKKDVMMKKFSFDLVIICLIVIGLLHAVCVYGFSNRVNFLFVPLMISLTIGVASLRRIKKLFYGVMAAYLICFGCFIKTYFKDYNLMLSKHYLFSFSYGLKDALLDAEEIHAKEGADIYLLEELYAYSKVLFYSKVNPYAYQRTVRWYDYPNAFVQAKDFLYYHFVWTQNYEQLEAGKIYIAHNDKKAYFKDLPYREYGNYIVAFKR